MHLCLNKVFLNVSHSVTNENSEQQLSKRWTPTAEALLAVIVHVFYATVYYYIHVCSLGFYRKSGKLKIEYDKKIPLTQIKFMFSKKATKFRPIPQLFSVSEHLTQGSIRVESQVKKNLNKFTSRFLDLLHRSILNQTLFDLRKIN